MGLREGNSLVAEWMRSGYLVGIGVVGVILIILGFRRDDLIGWIFLAAGVALVAIGFGSHFLGWEVL